MGKKNSTEWMFDALSRADGVECRNLPPEFLCGLRGALEAGLSCEEITALLVLFTGIYEAGENMTGSELVERAVHLSCLMKGDIRWSSEVSDRARQNRESRQGALLKKRGRKH